MEENKKGNANNTPSASNTTIDHKTILWAKKEK